MRYPPLSTNQWRACLNGYTAFEEILKRRNAWVSNAVGPKISEVKNQTPLWRAVQGALWNVVLMGLMGVRANSGLSARPLTLRTV